MDISWTVLTFHATSYGLIVHNKTFFWPLESQTRRHIDISLAPFLRPLALQHFYDAFGLRAELSIRVAAMEAFHLQEGELSNDLRVSAEAAVARGWTDHVEQPIDQNAPEADLRNVPIDVISVNASEVDSASSAGDGSDGKDDTSSSSSESSGSEPPLLRCLINIPC